MTSKSKFRFVLALILLYSTVVVNAQNYIVSKPADEKSNSTSAQVKNNNRGNNSTKDNSVPNAPQAIFWTENFDGVTPPTLPSGWTTETTGIAPAFGTAPGAFHTAPNVAVVNGSGSSSTSSLISAPIVFPIQQASFQFIFRQAYNFEWAFYNCRDGGVLEVSRDGEPFNDITSPVIGGTFIAGGYPYRFNSSNILVGRGGFCRTQQDYVTSIINLPGGMSGHSVRFRWRASWNASVATANPNWRIDTLSLSSTPLDPLNITVDTASDVPAANACTSAPRDCSLRGAIERTNATPGDDTISFDPTVFSTPQTMTLNFFNLAVENNGALTINGPGANLLTIDGNNNSHILQLNSGGTLNISGFTFTNGNAIFVNGLSGGGLQNNGGNLNVSNSAIINNHATNNGGGISGSGVTTVTNCTISGNSATNGGGIEIATGGTLTMTNSTVSNNTATNNAGGLLAGDDTTISSSTIGNNSAGNDGGGISEQDSSVINLLNTIVASNTATTSPDFSGRINSQGFNLIANTNGTTIEGTTTGNILNRDAKLLPLSTNNAVLQTQALLPDSPAINAGTSTNAPTLDERGKPRVGNIDIGAYEAGANLVVTNTQNSGAGSLRDAINFANGTTADESISFNIPPNDAGCVSQVCTITLTNGELGVANNGTLIISNSNGADKLRVSGNNASRVFNINSGANLTLTGLTIMNGSVSNDNGGGLRNDGTLTVLYSTFSANSALNSSGGGGGIANNGTIDLYNSTISTNSVGSGNGGGILNIGTMSITNSTISGNSADFGEGGGLSSSGNLNITNSTISGNRANIPNSGSNTQGGGISVSGGIANLTNSTISGNTAELLGGGIYVGNLATMNLTNVTIAYNSTTSSGGGISAIGILNCRNSIIANNSEFFYQTDISGTLNSQGYNFFANVSGIITGDTTGNIYDQPARLAPLGFYGGLTQTHALLSGSQAIDFGNSANSPTYDQRGAARNGTADIGAFELNNTANGGTFVATLPNGSQNVGYNYTLIPNDNGFTYSVTNGSLPNGLSLTSNFAVNSDDSKQTVLSPMAVVSLSGTPTQSGTFNFTVTATNGVNSNSTNYSMFVLGPTASNASVSGRVLTPIGRGLANAVITMTNQNGESINTRTNSFGYYRFDEVQSGETYIVSVVTKRYRYASQIVNVSENLEGLNFSPQ